MKILRKERYRIARESKFLQIQEQALKSENVDLRKKINELLMAKLQRGPMQTIENITTGAIVTKTGSLVIRPSAGSGTLDTLPQVPRRDQNKSQPPEKRDRSNNNHRNSKGS